MNILLFAGSLRTGSLNKKLIGQAKLLLKKSIDIKITMIDLQELNFPVFDGDIESSGIPENVQKLSKIVGESDALIISSPEYNASISAPLKNTVDWLSRTKPLTLSKKQILLLGASPGEFGAIRGLYHARACFETLGNFVYPRPFGLPKADKAFNEEGLLVDSITLEKLQKLLHEFIIYAQNHKANKSST